MRSHTETALAQLFFSNNEWVLGTETGLIFDREDNDGNGKINLLGNSRTSLTLSCYVQEVSSRVRCSNAIHERRENIFQNTQWTICFQLFCRALKKAKAADKRLFQQNWCSLHLPL